MPRRSPPKLEGPAAYAGLTRRRQQLGLPVGPIKASPVEVFETTFLDGPAAAKPHRLTAAPERWAVFAHRQAIGVVEVVLPALATPRQPELWTRFDYRRVDGGEGWATYRLDRAAA